MFRNIGVGCVGSAVMAVITQKRVVLSIAAGGAILVGYLGLGPTRRYLRTHALTRLISGSKAFAVSEEIRKRFRELTIPELPKRSEAHSHPLSSQERTRADIALNRFITACGYKVYSVSMSSRDVINDNDGHRLYFTAKDVALQPRCDTITPKHMLKFMDTDYYCNISDYAANMSAMVMYTFAPKKVAGATTDASYSIDSEGYVHLVSDGGARYIHQLWDYDTDHLVFDYWWGSVFYLVESQQLSDDRRIIGLFPVRKVYGPMGWWIPGERLERRKINHGALNIARYQVDSIVYVSMAQPDQTFCVSTTEECLAAICIRLKSKKANDADIADIERFLMTDGMPTPGKKAALLSDHLKIIINFLKLKIMTNTGKCLPDVITYQGLGPLITEDARPKARQIMVPLVTNGNVTPGDSFNNDNVCVQKRVLEPRNQVVSWPPIFHRWSEEFVRLLIPDCQMHTGVPDSIEEVMDKQNRPTQRAGALAALPFAFCYKTIVKSFQKGESYPKIAAPRNISTLDADHRTRYGGYLYALTRAVLKRQRWYAFAKTPKEIAAEVRRVATNARFIVPTDYSAWDGTHSKPLCDFENLVLRRFFGPEYHEEVSKLQMAQYKAPGVTRHGVRYNTEWSRLSGSSDTSSFNTIDNALVMFFALRDSGKTADEAWDSLGLFGGDDGIQANLEMGYLTRVVKRMGHVLKAKIIEPNHPVDFLGRYYLDPWTTEASVIDVQRQVRKLHITHSAQDVPWHVSLYCKAHGLMTTDAKTPLIAQWASKTMLELERVYGRGVLAAKLEKHSSALKEDRKWFSVYDFEEQFPQLPLDHELPNAFVASQFGLSMIELHTAIAKIDLAHKEEILTIGPLFTLPEREVAVGAVLNGEIYLPPEPPAQISQPETEVNSQNGDRNAEPVPKDRQRRNRRPRGGSSSTVPSEHSIRTRSSDRSSNPLSNGETSRNPSSEGSANDSSSRGRRRVVGRRDGLQTVPTVDNTSGPSLAGPPQPGRDAPHRQPQVHGIQQVLDLSRGGQEPDSARGQRRPVPARSQWRGTTGKQQSRNFQRKPVDGCRT